MPKQSSDSTKRSQIATILEGEYALVHLDPTQPNCILPDYLKSRDNITLKLSHLFRGSLEIAEDSIVTNLLFGSEYFECRIPFHAIWSITSSNGETTLWPECAPTSVLRDLLHSESSSPPEPPPEKQPEKRNQPKPDKVKASHLRRIK
ncbi:MAG: hypothetical protein KDD42_01055 [Bdellovibrionales bacterium]|nr:hypothetical protein [Bdellovibrionales bacterium]